VGKQAGRSYPQEIVVGKKEKEEKQATPLLLL
jgi:hypothetical protein